MEASYESAQEKMRQEIHASVLRRFEQLNGVVLETASDGLKFLNLIQLSGMAGILSFIGATKFSSIYLSLAFGCFFVGVIFLGCAYLLRYLHFSSILGRYLQDVHDMNASVNDMTWGKVNVRDRHRTNRRFDFVLTFVILSLGLFVVGGAMGYLGVDSYARTVKAASGQPVKNSDATGRLIPSMPAGAMK